MATAEVPQFAPLDKDATADVCVIGAGIAGLTTAYMLARNGKSVIVIDDGPIAGGETQRTTAHLSNVVDDRYTQVQRIFGTDKTSLVYQAHTKAIDTIEQIVRDEGIDCDFIRLDGYLFQGEKDKSVKALQKEFEACQKVGFEGIRWLDKLPLEHSKRQPACIKFPRQAQFHPLRYLTALTRAILRMNGSIYAGTHVTEVKDGSTVIVETDKGFKVLANFVVVATNSPVTDWVKVHTKQAPYRTYAIAAEVPSGSVPLALYWDTENPYHYVRTQPTEDPSTDLLIVGGEDHRTGEKNDAEVRFTKLEQWAREMFPAMGTVRHRWSGQVYETIDGLAYIGKDPAHGENVFIATGDSGMGMTHGTIAGLLLSDLIVGNPNEWVDVFSPTRKPIAAGLDWVMENANTALQYLHFLQTGEKDAVSQIEAGEGAVIQHQGERVAVYRDTNGSLSECSAICPHLKAIVTWNSCEKTWDCPAHGSRFDAYGQVLNGPANQNLKQLPPDKELPDNLGDSSPIGTQDDLGLSDSPPM